MSFSYLKQLPTPEEIKQTYPLSEACQKIKQKRDAEIARVLRGESDKFLVIIGPCSADKEEPVMDYIHRLANVNEQTKDKLIIIRVSTQTNRVLPAKDTKELPHSRTRKQNRIWLQD